MQPWRQSPRLFVKPNVLPWLHFTQIKGLIPLQLSSSYSSHTHPHTNKEVSGLVLSDHPRWVWSFLQREFLAREINLTRLIHLTWSDFRSSSPVCWAYNCQPSLIAIDPGLLCHWSGSSTGLASCIYILPLFLCWKLWEGGKAWEDKARFHKLWLQWSVGMQRTVSLPKHRALSQALWILFVNSPTHFLEDFEGII